jgi:hypothetical protein
MDCSLLLSYYVLLLMGQHYVMSYFQNIHVSFLWSRILVFSSVLHLTVLLMLISIL